MFGPFLSFHEKIIINKNCQNFQSITPNCWRNRNYFIVGVFMKGELWEKWEKTLNERGKIWYYDYSYWAESTWQMNLLCWGSLSMCQLDLGTEGGKCHRSGWGKQQGCSRWWRAATLPACYTQTCFWSRANLIFNLLYHQYLCVYMYVCNVNSGLYTINLYLRSWLPL